VNSCGAAIFSERVFLNQKKQGSFLSPFVLFDVIKDPLGLGRIELPTSTKHKPFSLRFDQAFLEKVV